MRTNLLTGFRNTSMDEYAKSLERQERKNVKAWEIVSTKAMFPAQTKNLISKSSDKDSRRTPLFRMHALSSAFILLHNETTLVILHGSIVHCYGPVDSF